MTIIVTGAAGFIGFHLSKRLLEEKFKVVGIDSVNDYYDVSLKHARLNILKEKFPQNFLFYKENLENRENILNIFKDSKPRYVVNLAAQAGVRYSIKNPFSYVQANLVGFINIIECCRELNVEHFIYASSSSVYGGNVNMPLSEMDNVDHPISLYAATKKSNELMAHSYSHLYNIPTTGLRFFTVYGPWGRPDMALFLFTKAILERKPIKVFNSGEMVRDFTYIDDIVESLIRVVKKKPVKNQSFDRKNSDPSTSWAPFKIFNIGNSNPVKLMEFIQAIESSLGLEAEKIYLPIQDGDVPITHAKTDLLENWIDFKPKTSIETGIKNFVTWYKEFYKYE